MSPATGTRTRRPGRERFARATMWRLNNPAFLALIGDLRGRDVLDAGCGEGYNTRLLARAGARMSGVDISERMIALAVEEERRAPLGIHYHCTPYTRLDPFAAGTFDAVVSF